MADKQDIEKIDIILDEQMTKFPSGAQIHRVKQGVPIKMVNTDIEFLFDHRGANTGIMVCGIATVDGVYYAALCDARKFPPQGYVEEIFLSPGKTTIKTTRLIMSQEEWAVLVDFFQKNNVWDKKRLFNWIWGVKNGTVAVSNEWVKKLNKDMDRLGRRPVTEDELAQASSRLISEGPREDDSTN